MKLGKRKKKTPKGYDVSVGGNIDYNKPNFSATSSSRSVAKRKLYNQLAKAGAVSGEAKSENAAESEYRKKGYKQTLSYVGDDTKASMKVQSPANLEGGGKMRGYKFMEEGGETDPPKKGKYSFVQQAAIDNSLPTDEASLKELIETASKEKRQTVEVGDATGALMWTASEEGKEYDGLTGISEKGSAKAADYYDTLIAKAEEKLMSIKSKDDEESRMLEPGEFGENLGKELEKGERGYKF
tara:strand:+ start:70 stop:792 length:723 start_codon:yes stop_codon:yes gene_type:complete